MDRDRVEVANGLKEAKLEVVPLTKLRNDYVPVAKKDHPTTADYESNAFATANSTHPYSQTGRFAGGRRC